VNQNQKLILIREIAAFTRRELVAWIKANPETGTFAPKTRNNLQGWCGVASYILTKTLKSCGFKPRMVYGLYEFLDEEHVWVEVDGYIVDITASQFGVCRKDNVYMVPFDKADRKGKFRGIAEGNRRVLSKLQDFDVAPQDRKDAFYRISFRAKRKFLRSLLSGVSSVNAVV